MKYHRRARRRRRRDDRTARARGSDAAEQPGSVAKCTSQTNPVCACDVLLCACVRLCIGEGSFKKASYTHSCRRRRPILSSGAEQLSESDNQYFSNPNYVGRHNNKKIKINVYVCVCVCACKQVVQN